MGRGGCVSGFRIGLGWIGGRTVTNTYEEVLGGQEGLRERILYWVGLDWGRARTNT